MANESSPKTPNTLTKKHMARLEKEKRQNRILTIGIITIIAVIVVLVTLAIFSNQISAWYKNTFTYSKAAAEVGDKTITVKDFQDRVSYERYQTVYTFTYYASSFYATFLQDQLLDLQNRLDNYVQFGSDVLDQMIGEQAMILKANQMGITVTDQEVEEELQANLGYYPNGTPTAVIPTVTLTLLPTSTLNPQQMTLMYVAPTEVVPTEIPATTEPVVEETEVATEAPTEAPTEEVTATAIPTEETPTETATITPTATPYTLEGYQNLYATVVADMQTNASFSESELREYVRMMLYQRKVFAEISKDVSPMGEKVWARHILVPDSATAEVILTKLNSGEDWTALAAEFSTDTSTSAYGGDLGWFAKGAMVSEFEDAAWALEIGEISEPVKTDYGYHIIQVLGHEERQLTADELSTAQNLAYNAFIEAAKTEFDVTKNDVWASNVPSTPTIPDEYRISSGN
jgi:parvulin-like peptidyl-prolyl isomerase